MKKRFSAFFLALALCLGLAVPAFAADEGPSLTFEAPDNSGIIYEAQATDVGAIGFARSGSNNAHIVYGTYEDWTGGVMSLVFFPSIGSSYSNFIGSSTFSGAKEISFPSSQTNSR